MTAMLVATTRHVAAGAFRQPRITVGLAGIAAIVIAQALGALARHLLV